MKRRYTIMEDNIGETQVKLEQALLVANEVPSLVTHKNDSTIHVTPSNKTAWNGAVTDIGTKANLLTADKSNLVSAVNELFTSANNGKTAVANAITAKGVSASPTDTFAVLADKVGQINTGKKWASGTARSVTNSNIPFLYANGTTNNYPAYITVSDLRFLPSVIMVGYKVSDNVYHHSSYQKIIPDIITTGGVVKMTIFNSHTSSHENNSFLIDGTNCYIRDSGFRFPVSSSGYNYDWFAIE